MYLCLLLFARAVASVCRILFSAKRGRSTTGSREAAGTRSATRSGTVDRRDARPVTDVVVASDPPHIDGTESIGDLRASSGAMSHEQLLHELWGPVYRRETQYLRVHAAVGRR